MTISIEQAQLRLADLVERIRRGEEIVITQSGQSVARLVPSQAPAEQPTGAHDPWAQHRARLEAAGLHVPAPGTWNINGPRALGTTTGPSASETLINDRR